MQGQSVRLDGVQVTYPNGFVAVEPTDLAIEAGEFFSILGPSGCGKTTLLKTISGFLSPSAGTVSIGDQPQNGILPDRRPTALIFQNLALFPLMSVLDNVAFGLEVRGFKKRERRIRAQALLDLVQLSGYANQRPDDLSGGQKQRVAIARALAVEPSVLLLDEPLSALDLKLRQHMRAELRAIQKRTGVTFIYITHDQGEALSMSDRIAVMDQGRILQIGTSEALYHHPASAFVASFVGEANRLDATVESTTDEWTRYQTALGPLLGRNSEGLKPGERALVFIRPEHIHFGLHTNSFKAKAKSRVLEGSSMLYRLNAANLPLTLQGTNDPAGLVELETELTLGIHPSHVMGLPLGAIAKTGSDLEQML